MDELEKIETGEIGKFIEPRDSAAKVIIPFPMPQHDPEQNSAVELFLRPVPLLGQVFGGFCLMALLCQLPVLHKSLLILLPLGGKYLGFSLLAGLLGTMVAAYKLKLNVFFRFLTGSAFPITVVTGVFRPMPFIALGDALEVQGRHAESAECNAKAAAIIGPFGLITNHSYILREYLLSLMHAGNQALADDFAQRWLEHATYICEEVDSKSALTYSSYCFLIVSLLYEFSGNLTKANEIRIQSFERFKDQPTDSEALHYANLGYANYLLSEARYKEAKQLLENFVEVGFLCPKIIWADSSKDMAYTSLALASAHCGDFKKAERCLMDRDRLHSKTLCLDIANLEVKTRIALLRRRDNEALTVVNDYINQLKINTNPYVDQHLLALKELLSATSPELAQKIATTKLAQTAVMSTTRAVLIGQDELKPILLQPTMSDVSDLSRESKESWAHIRALIVFAAIYSFSFVHKEWVTVATFWLLLIISSTVLYVQKRRKLLAARTAISSGNFKLSKIKLVGGRVQIFNQDGSVSSCNFGSKGDFTALSKLTEEKQINAVIYYNVLNQAVAINVLGFCSTLSGV